MQNPEIYADVICTRSLVGRRPPRPLPPIGAVLGRGRQRRHWVVGLRLAEVEEQLLAAPVGCLHLELGAKEAVVTRRQYELYWRLC